MKMVVLIIMLKSCSSSKEALVQQKRLHYKEITKNVSLANKNEVKLAQHLWHEMMKEN